jgi:hypothetical protein
MSLSSCLLPFIAKINVEYGSDSISNTFCFLTFFFIFQRTYPRSNDEAGSEVSVPISVLKRDFYFILITMSFKSFPT